MIYWLSTPQPESETCPHHRPTPAAAERVRAAAARRIMPTQKNRMLHRCALLVSSFPTTPQGVILPNAGAGVVDPYGGVLQNGDAGAIFPNTRIRTVVMNGDACERSYHEKGTITPSSAQMARTTSSPWPLCLAQDCAGGVFASVLDKKIIKC